MSCDQVGATGNCRICGVDEFRRVIYKFCPNLESLTANGCKGLNDQQPAGPETVEEYREPGYGERPNLKSLFIDTFSSKCPVSWFELLSHFPSLTSLKIKGNDSEFGFLIHDDSTSINKVLGTIKLIKTRYPAKLPITEFEIVPHIKLQDGTSHEIFDILQELDIAAKGIHVILGNRGENLRRDYVRNVVNFHAKSLTSLKMTTDKLFLIRRHLQLNWNFPFGVTLEKLKILEIGSHCFVENMEFLKYIPNLTELEILSRKVPRHHFRNDLVNNRPYPETNIISNTLETEELARLQLRQLKSLKFEYTLNEADVRRLIRWLPNVEKLDMVLNDQQLAIICEHWKDLTKLGVRGKELTDEGVIGRTVGEVGGDDDGGAGGNPVVEARPNITHLQKLAYFQANSDKLTEAAVFHGFLKVPTLVHLQLPKITNKASRVLRESGVVFVSRT